MFYDVYVHNRIDELCFMIMMCIIGLMNPSNPANPANPISRRGQPELNPNPVKTRGLGSGWGWRVATRVGVNSSPIFIFYFHGLSWADLQPGPTRPSCTLILSAYEVNSCFINYVSVFFVYFVCMMYYSFK